MRLYDVIKNEMLSWDEKPMPKIMFVAKLGSMMSMTNREAKNNAFTQEEYDELWSVFDRLKEKM